MIRDRPNKLDYVICVIFSPIILMGMILGYVADSVSNVICYWKERWKS